jgi:phosphoribosylformimino-5-aminoimidazole carboxamide ribotide isomerase
MNIIPAIDIIKGKCVRLYKGDYSQQTEYESSAQKMTKYFSNCRADKIHLIDLDAAKEKKLVNLETVKMVCETSEIPVEYGGGIRSSNDVEQLFELGVSQVIIGSLAVTKPDLIERWIQKYGEEKIIVAVDALDGEVKISAWEEGGKTKTTDLIQKTIRIGAKTINYTDISRDGTLSSPNFEVYQQLVDQYPDVKIVASGGVSSSEDLDQLRNIGVDGVIIGKALYEGNINLNEIC